MLCPPIPWESSVKGGHILWRSPVVRTKMDEQLAEVREPSCCAQAWPELGALS